MSRRSAIDTPYQADYFCEDLACLQEPIPRRPKRRDPQQSSRKRANVKAMTAEELVQHKEKLKQRKRERDQSGWRSKHPLTAKYTLERDENPDWQPQRKRT
jgi:hypothetical protein